MKAKIISILIMAVIIIGAILNSAYIDKEIKNITEEVVGLEIANDCRAVSEEADKLYAFFKDREDYISITVSHDDLTVTEELFSEMIARIKEGDGAEARIIKSRLIDALKHLRRLSGVNIDSVI